MERIKEGRVVRRQGVEVERCKSVSTIQRMIGGKWKIEILLIQNTVTFAPVLNLD